MSHVKSQFNSNKLDSRISSIHDSRSFWSKLRALITDRNDSRLSRITKTEWLEHFESLFSDPNRNENDNIEELQIDEPNDEIKQLIFNGDITEDEVLVAIKNLKRGKSAGPDEFFLSNVLNFYYPSLLTYSIDYLNMVVSLNAGQTQYSYLFIKREILTHQTIT